jgi:hypothetical protein
MSINMSLIKKVTGLRKSFFIVGKHQQFTKEKSGNWIMKIFKISLYDLTLIYDIKRCKLVLRHTIWNII